MDNDKEALELHKKIAIETNGKAWSLLEKERRSPEEDLLLIEAAYTSLYHWQIAGTAVHAQKCLKITLAHPETMADFDFAYAHEGMARALALNNELQKASEYLQQAREWGEKIQNPEDRQIYISDLNSGNWFGTV